MSNFAWWYNSLSFTHSYHFQWPRLHLNVTAVSNGFNWKFYVLIRLGWNFVQLLIMSSRSWICTVLSFAHVQGRLLTIFLFEKKSFIIRFFSDIIKARFFKLCLIITLLGVYIVIVGLMTLTLFQGHWCVTNINCKFRVLDSCPLV